jgi:hypothetical protein
MLPLVSMLQLREHENIPLSHFPAFHRQVKIETAAFTHEAAEHLWAARTKAPYPRGSIHSAAAQDAWREQTHLCCDIILLMSDFGQLRYRTHALFPNMFCVARRSMYSLGAGVGCRRKQLRWKRCIFAMKCIYVERSA